MPLITDGCACGCYLLESDHPRHRGYTYIGFTVNPNRRLRQHNGFEKGGAKRTEGRRPHTMVLFVHGFSSNTAAEQFEWAWTNPKQSKKLRDLVPSGSRTLAARIHVLTILLTKVLPYRYMPPPSPRPDPPPPSKRYSPTASCR